MNFRYQILGWGIGLVAAALLINLHVHAQAEGADQGTISNQRCLECHGEPGISMPLENGELLPLFIDSEVYNQSVHGESGYACVQCHTEVGDYPHPEFSAEDRRDLSLKLYESCQLCHSGEYQQTQDSAHAQARAEGNREAAICTDCHGAHNTRRLTHPQTGRLLPDARLHIPQTCARCHNAIFLKYRASVHGSALLDAQNTDVPTCIDCHGVHDIEDPTTAEFRLRSPQICANCHTDPELMGRYGLSTNVLRTYVSDFHGTTVTLFRKISPDAETNKPVCYDCHGLHDIRRTDDPQKGIQVRENLLARCQSCHPNATVNFEEAWLSHYIPSPERHPIVYYVDQFYALFIPTVLGGMAVLVLMDITWQIRRRLGVKGWSPPWRRVEAAVSTDPAAEPSRDQPSPPDDNDRLDSQMANPSPEDHNRHGVEPDEG